STTWSYSSSVVARTLAITSFVAGFTDSIRGADGDSDEREPDQVPGLVSPSPRLSSMSFISSAPGLINVLFSSCVGVRSHLARPGLQKAGCCHHAHNTRRSGY